MQKGALMTSIREATAEAIRLEGAEVLGEPRRFLSLMLDLVDYRLVERDVLIKWGDEKLLGLYAKAADVGRASEFESAFAKGTTYLRDHCATNLEVARSLSYGLAQGPADALGVAVELPEPRLPRSPAFQVSRHQSKATEVTANAGPVAAEVPSREVTRPNSQLVSQPVAQPVYGPGSQQFAQPVPSPAIRQYTQSVSQPAIPPQPGPSGRGQVAAKPHNALLIVIVFLFVGAAVAAGTFMLMPHLSAGTNGAFVGEETTVIHGSHTETEAEVVQEADTPSVRDSLSAYSWTELGEISQLMQDAGSRSAALDIAEKYNLMEDGRFVSATKDVSLNDDMTLHMRLVDVMHDELAFGGGYASMTFLAANVSHHHRMAPDTKTSGGWEASEMRSWMLSTLYGQLPAEVASVIVPVYKYSNNVGSTYSDSCVTSTRDYLWLPSIVELCGEVHWTFDKDKSNSEYHSSVFNAEGSQFAYYAQLGIQKSDENNQNDCLALGEIWWLRSTASSSGRGRYVNSAGDPSTFGDSNESHGVVVGFCV